MVTDSLKENFRRAVAGGIVQTLGGSPLSTEQIAELLGDRLAWWQKPESFAQSRYRLASDTIPFVSQHERNENLTIQIDGELEAGSVETWLPWCRRPWITNVEIVCLTALGGAFDSHLNLVKAAGDKLRRVHVATCACSAAALLVATANCERTMAGDAWLMLHAPRNVCVGTFREMRAEAQRLEAYTEEIATQLCDRTGASPGMAAKWLCADTWFSSKAALAHNLIDAITP